MLEKDTLVQTLEKGLADSGVLEPFVSLNGPIVERVVVDFGDAPKSSDIELSEGDKSFVATYDSIDCVVGIVFNTTTHTPSSGLWVQRQADNATPPTSKHIERFVDTLMSSIDADGNLRMPYIGFYAENGQSLKING